MDIVFQPNGNFDEVYLYVWVLFSCLLPMLLKRVTGRAYGGGSPCHRELPIGSIPTSYLSALFVDSFRATTHRCTFPVFPIPNPLRTKVYPFRQRLAPRPQTRQPPR